MTVAAASSSLNQKPGPDRSHEPSMEEILASIRRIIAEDQPVTKPVAAAPAPVVEPKVERIDPPSRPMSPTVAELDSAVERLRRALEPMVDAGHAAAPKSRGPEADVLKPEVLAPAQPEPVVEAKLDLGPPPALLRSPPPAPIVVAPAVEAVAAPAVQIEMPVESLAEAQPAPHVEIEPPAPALRPASPFPSLEKAFPGSAPVLQRVANDLPIEVVRPASVSAADAPSRAELLSQPPVAAMPEPAAPVAEQVEPEAPATDETLLSPMADASIASSFQALATSVLFQDKSMIEEVAKDMLRPMLKQWLDDNLPVMVERLVRSEIERVARGGRG